MKKILWDKPFLHIEGSYIKDVQLGEYFPPFDTLSWLIQQIKYVYCFCDR